MNRGLHPQNRVKAVITSTVTASIAGCNTSPFAANCLCCATESAIRRKAALRSSGAPGGARVVERIGSGFEYCFNRDALEEVVVMEREEGCGRWLMANAGVVGVETRLLRGEMSEARCRLERRVVRKAGVC